jgi:hypothetical protein
VHHDIGDSGYGASNALLDRTSPDRAPGQRLLAGEREREKGDDAFVGADEAELSRGRPGPRRPRIPLQRSTAISSPAALGQRLEMRLHGFDLWHIGEDRLDLLAIACARSSEVAGSFRCSDTSN